MSKYIPLTSTIMICQRKAILILERNGRARKGGKKEKGLHISGA